MSSVLSGNLAFIEVLQILRLVVADQRDGRLVLQKDDERGEIYVEGGRIVHASSESYIGEPAFRDLVLWSAGKFAFDADTRPPQKSIEKETAQLLTEAAEQTEQWRRIKNLIPSFRIPFRKTTREPEGDMKLKAKDWEVLNLLSAGELSVIELAERLNMRDIDLAGILYTLMEGGLIEVGTASRPVRKEVVTEKFFKQIENELIQLIGPVASIIIDDVVESLGETRDEFPKDKVPSLVESITGEIYDPAKQLTFQQYMLKQIKSL